MVTATVKGLPGFSSKRKSLKVRLDSLVVHPLAQRTLIPSWVKYLEDHIDIDLIGVISVVMYKIGGREGYWIVDGQHRYKALMGYGCGDLMVEVHYYEDVKDDATSCKLFRLLNKKKTVGPWDDFDKGYKSGDPTCVGIANCLTRHGLAVAKNAADDTLNCIATLRRVYLFDGGTSLDQSITVCKEAWGSKASNMEGSLIEGMSRVFHKYNGKVEIPVLIVKLQKTKPKNLIGEGMSLSKIKKRSLSRCIGEIIVDRYNVKRTTGRLDPF
jgi:hypothetical protein